MNEQEILQDIIEAAGPLGWSPTPDADEVGPYAVLGELAQHLVKQLEAGATAQFDKLFDAIEGLLSSTSPEARELITVGFLEDLQNISLNRGVHLTAWTPWLGSNTTDAWKALEGAWSGELSASQFNDRVRGRAAGNE